MAELPIKFELRLKLPKLYEILVTTYDPQNLTLKGWI